MGREKGCSKGIKGIIGNYLSRMQGGQKVETPPVAPRGGPAPMLQSGEGPFYQVSLLL